MKKLKKFSYLYNLSNLPLVSITRTDHMWSRIISITDTLMPKLRSGIDNTGKGMLGFISSQVLFFSESSCVLWNNDSNSSLLVLGRNPLHRPVVMPRAPYISTTCLFAPAQRKQSRHHDSWSLGSFPAGNTGAPPSARCGMNIERPKYTTWTPGMCSTVAEQSQLGSHPRFLLEYLSGKACLSWGGNSCFADFRDPLLRVLTGG